MPDDYPPDYSDELADLIAEEFADAAEECDRMGEAWFEQHYQPGVTDPAATSEGTPQ